MTSSTNKRNCVRFITVSSAQAGQRIDNFLITLEKGIPKSRIYRAIRKGEVRVNKGRIKQTYKIQPGDTLRIPPLRSKDKSTVTTVNNRVREQLNNNILYEDEDLLVLNKPSGLAVHAGSHIDQGLIESLRIIRTDLPFIELVHRLDRDTSGCLLLAKNRQALLHLQQQIIEQNLNKRYLTLLKDGWSSGERCVEQPLRKNTLTSGERMVRVSADGKQAKTVFIPLEHYPGTQLTEVKLYTGRTHQIRVHAAFMRCPVAGDDKYGDRSFNRDMKKTGLKRLFLHAWKLDIRQPSSGQLLTLKAPIPEHLDHVITQLGHQ